ncbi:MAG: DUF4200 domain-containing protein [Bacteroidia bacterium]
MIDTERQAYALSYPKTFAKVTENLPASYLDKDSSGFQPGVLNHGPEHDALLVLLRDKATWNDPGLAKLVLSMVFQAFDKQGGFTTNTPMPETRIATADEKLALEVLSPQLLLDNIKSGEYDESNELLYTAAQKILGLIGGQKFIAEPADEQMLLLLSSICSPQNPVKESINDLLAIKYAENQENAAIRPVLDEMHVTINGYQPPESKGPYKEYNLGKLIVGSIKTLRKSTEHKGVKLAYLGLKNTASVKGFSLDALQESAGGTLAGVQFGREGEKNAALLDFDANFKNGTANVDAASLPFQSINYLSDSFTFKTDSGYFNVVKAHFEWPEDTKEEERQGLGKVKFEIGDLLMNNLRVIFEDETYGLSKLSMTGLKATIYQPLGKLNSLSQLQEKFIDVFYEISQFITYAIQLSINRFSPETGPDAKKSLSEVLARTLYEELAFDMTFDSLDIENLLIIDNDFPAGKTAYPDVDASQESMKKISLGQTALSINSKTPDPEIENYKIKQIAFGEKRELTDAERETIRINKEKAAELHVKQAELRKKKARLKRLLLKNEEKGETGKRNAEIKKLQEEIAQVSKPEFHLTFETSGLSLDNPDMMNKIIARQTSSLAENTSINTLPEEKGVSIGKTRFETDFTQEGLTNSSLFITDLVIPDVTTSAIHYISEDKLTKLYGDDTHLTGIKASFNVYFKDPVPENPDVLIDYIEVLDVFIGEAAITRLQFRKDSPGKEAEDPHTLQNLTVPKGERIIINDLSMSGWKIAWDDQNKMISSVMDEKSMQAGGITSSKIGAGNLLLPKGTEFKNQDMAKDGSTIIASTLDNVSFKNIKFAATRSQDSKAIDKTDYSYSYAAAEGVIRLQQAGIDKKGKTTDLGADLNVGGTKLSNGLYYKESDEADVIGFSLNKINLENFHYISDKFNIHANKPTVFNDVGLSTIVTYKLDKDNKRTGVKSVMLRGFTIDNIRSNDLEVYSFTKKNEWMKVVLPGLMESGLNEISVSGLGYDFETKKPLYSSSTDISVGIEDTIPALFVPKLQTIFGNKFAADYSTLKVGTIHLHQSGDSEMAALDVEGIVINDIEMSKFNVGDSKMKITSSGKNAHLKTINADISFEFDPGFSSKKKSMIVRSLTAKQLVVYGLKITNGPAGKEKMVVDLKPEEKSTIDDISIENFVVKWDEAGATKVDYSTTVASTGKVNAADLSVQIGKAFSLESGVEASGISFKGLGGENFDLNIFNPSLTNIKDKSAITGSGGNGAVTFGNEGKGPIIKGSALVLKKGQDGKMSYALKDPEIKRLKVDLPKKGLHFLMDGNMIGGEFDVTEGMMIPGSELSDAWVMKATQDFNVTNLELTWTQVVPDPNAVKVTHPYKAFDTFDGSVTLTISGEESGSIAILNGAVDAATVGSNLGGLMDTLAATQLTWGPNAFLVFNWLDTYAYFGPDPWLNPLMEGLNDDQAASQAFFATWVNGQLSRTTFEQRTDGVYVLVGDIVTGTDAIKVSEDVLTNHNLLISRIIEYQLTKPAPPVTANQHLPASWNPANFATLEDLFNEIYTNTAVFEDAGYFKDTPRGAAISEAFGLWIKSRLFQWINRDMGFRLKTDALDLEGLTGIEFDKNNLSNDVSLDLSGTMTESTTKIEANLSKIPAFSYTSEDKSAIFSTSGITLDKTILNDLDRSTAGGEKITDKKIIISGMQLKIKK